MVNKTRFEEELILSDNFEIIPDCSNIREKKYNIGKTLPLLKLIVPGDEIV